MGLIDELSGKVVGLDTVVILYYVKDDPQYASYLQPLFEAIAAGDLVGVTSTVTIVESLVRPLREKDDEQVQEIKTMLLESENILTFDLTAEIAEKAAGLRAEHGYKTPDAIQLATAIVAGAETFVTNDRRIRSIEKLKVLVLQDFVEAQS